LNATRGVAWLALAAALAGPAHAERADREKQVVVLADRGVLDEKSQTRTMEGNVVITQGTMRITAAKVTVQQKDNYNYYVASGSPVTFREKRDKLDEWIEGIADRAEFDDRNEVLKLFNRARVTSAQSEITGELITYDMRREVAEVSGAPPGQQVPSDKSRVKVIIVPKPTAAPGKGEAPRDAPQLKREEGLK
jgi:lipopolysaccharide export system protein LptA